MKIVGIRFHKGGRVYHFDPRNIKLEIGDMVVVETTFGEECGQVIYVKDTAEERLDRELMPVIRKFEKEDYDFFKKKEKDREKYMTIVSELVASSGLNMKIMDANFSFDDSKITFIFSSENRIDFRQLVKDLNRKLKKQVVLRQIGPRDEARFLGGYGRCGRPFCCGTFLQNLESVTMDMAKAQNMSSKGSSKISGVCGKLMCCLAYEVDIYKEMAKNFPAVGAKVKTKKGQGVIIDQNIIKQSVLVELDKNSAKVETPISEITILKN